MVGWMIYSRFNVVYHSSTVRDIGNDMMLIMWAMRCIKPFLCHYEFYGEAGQMVHQSDRLIQEDRNCLIKRSFWNPE